MPQATDDYLKFHQWSGEKNFEIAEEVYLQVHQGILLEVYLQVVYLYCIATCNVTGSAPAGTTRGIRRTCHTARAGHE